MSIIKVTPIKVGEEIDSVLYSQLSVPVTFDTNKLLICNMKMIRGSKLKKMVNFSPCSSPVAGSSNFDLV